MTPQKKSRPGAVAIFVKTPGISHVKTRLAATVGKEKAEKFYNLSSKATASVVRKAGEQTSLQLYWAVAEKQALTHPLWQDHGKIFQGIGALGARLHHVYQALLAQHPFVLLLGADSPHLDPQILVYAAEVLSRSPREVFPARFVMGQAKDGGFYLFGGHSPVSGGIWESVPYSHSETAKELKRRLIQLGEVWDLPSSFDVDTREDLEDLSKEWFSKQGRMLLAEQQNLFQWIRELR